MDSGHRAKFLLVFISLTLLTGLSMGASIDYEFGTIEYDKEEYVTINCYGSDCPYNENLDTRIRVEMCGDSKKISHDSDTEYGFTMQVPQDGDLNDAGFSCDVGYQSFDVYDPELGSDDYLGGGEFDVSYSHGELSGGLLALTVELDSINKDDLKTWQIYDGGDFDGENGEMRIKEPDPVDSEVVYRTAKTGKILSESRSGPGFVNELNELAFTQYTDCAEAPGAAGSCEVSQLSMGSDLAAECQGNCPMGRMDKNDAPDLKLRGEIIVGDETDPAGGLRTGGGVAKDQKRFHLCDTSVQGIHDIEDRVVYSPGDDFDADNFVCKDDQWIERPECKPSEEFRDGSRGWNCYEKDPTTIDVQYLDIKNVPYGDFTSSFLGGFKIPASQLYDFEYHYYPNEVRLEHVQAECWMGNNDNRPSSDSKKGEIRVDASNYRDSGPDTVPSNFEDMWVLTQIPYREDVINKTYSCVYGFDARFGAYEDVMFQAVNDFTLNSKDSGKIEVDYRNLEDIYSNNQGSYTDGLHWAWDSSGDDRSSRFDAGGDYSDSQLNPFEQEHPYCPGPPSGNEVIC